MSAIKMLRYWIRSKKNVFDMLLDVYLVRIWRQCLSYDIIQRHINSFTYNILLHIHSNKIIIQNYPDSSSMLSDSLLW